MGDILKSALKRSRSTKGGQPAKRQRATTPTPPSPVSPNIDVSLTKRRGKLREGGQRVAPREVADDAVFKRWPALPSNASKGIFNPANLCYRNASLQSLLHIPAFYNFLGKIHADCLSVAEECVVCSLQELAYRYWRSPGTPEISYDLISQFTASCKANLPTFHDIQAREIRKDLQSDAFEFLDYIIRQQIKPYTDAVVFEKFFEIPVIQSWECKKCGAISESSPPPSELGINVAFTDFEDGHDMKWYLRNSFFNDTLTQRIWCDNPRCVDSKVSSKTRQSKDGDLRKVTRQITSAPEILILRLGRFEYTKSSFSKTRVLQKSNRPIPFVETLSLNPHRHDSLEDDCIYRLDAVVSHIGKDVKSGHYIASCRTLSGRYEIIDDSRISGPVNDFGTTMQNPVFRPTVKEGEASPYVLVYTKL